MDKTTDGVIKIGGIEYIPVEYLENALRFYRHEFRETHKILDRWGIPKTGKNVLQRMRQADGAFRLLSPAAWGEFRFRARD